METNNKALVVMEEKSKDRDSSPKDNATKEIITKYCINDEFRSDQGKGIADNIRDMTKEQGEIPPEENAKGDESKSDIPRGQDPVNNKGSANKDQNGGTTRGQSGVSSQLRGTHQ